MLKYKKMTSPKHPNWIVEKEINTITKKIQWNMQHNDYPMYMIGIGQTDGEYWGEICTKQRVLSGRPKSWEVCSNPFSGTIEQVKKEIVRRGTYWAKKNS